MHMLLPVSSPERVSFPALVGTWRGRCEPHTDPQVCSWVLGFCWVGLGPGVCMVDFHNLSLGFLISKMEE